MILQALYDLARKEKLVSDPDFAFAPIAWLVTVSPAGKLLGIEDTRAMSGEGRTKPKLLAKAFSIPRQPGRTSGDRAFFLCDKSEYALGVASGPNDGAARAPEKLANRFTLFRAQLKACLDATGDDGVRAVWTMLEDVAAGRQVVRLADDCASNDQFAFVYEPDVDTLVHQRPAVQAYWRALRKGSENPVTDARFTCLVTGEAIDAPGNFPKVKNVPGGQSSGVPLVSFNASAFTSYGLDSNENAPISRAAAEACATALDRLLHPAFPDPQPGRSGYTMPRRNLRLSADTAVCYWSSSPQSDQFLDLFRSVLEVVDVAQVGDVYQSLWRGRPVAIDDPAAFYALTLSGAQGRMIVRDWFETSVAEVVVNIARYFGDLEIVRNTPPPKGRELPPALPLRALLGAMAPRGDAEGIPAPLASALVRSALRGAPYPISILQRAIERMRAEIGSAEWADLERRDARAALIKAVLVRTFNYEVTPAMDPTNTSPGYLCGRMLAVIERLQQLALGDVNASVVDRYFGSASATPRAVFVRLLKNAHHHTRKAEDDPKTAGSARWLRRQLDEISAPFDPKHNGFPAYLNLEQQGLFMLGYHHQRHALWQKREDRERVAPSTESEDEQPIAVAQPGV